MELWKVIQQIYSVTITYKGITVSFWQMFLFEFLVTIVMGFVIKLFRDRG